MAQRLAELCSILIENAYGDLAAQIFTILSEYGRLSLLSLRQLSGIPPRRLKVALTTLIQHHIVLHHALDEYEPTEFQVDWHAAYALVRSRKVIELVTNREGEAAGQIISNILQLGHVSVGDLVDEYNLEPGSKRDSAIDTVEDYMNEHGLVNGIAKEGKSHSAQSQITSISKLHQALRRLLAEGFLLKVNDRTYMPVADLDKRVREAVIADDFPDGKVTGPKKAKAFRSAVNRLKRKWQHEDDYSETRDIGSHGEIKRSTPLTSSNKRIKPSDTTNGVNHQNHAANAEADEKEDIQVDKLPSDLIVRVNFARCTTLLRNQRLERMVDRFLGPTTAVVFRALLRALENRTKLIRSATKSDDADDNDDEDDEMESATDAEIYEHLDPLVDIDSKYLPAKNLKPFNGVRNHRKKNRGTVNEAEDGTQPDIKVETHSDSEHEHEIDSSMPFEQRNKRLASIARHLKILAEHPKRFCVRLPGSMKTKVDFNHTANLLIRHEIETMIDARFGKVPTRFIRILQETGKIDVQQLADMTMTRHNDACTRLTALQFAGLAHGQEIARNSTHDTARAVHLWWFDEDFVVSQYLERTYQAMARTLQRLRFERETTFKAAIDKAERIDVRGRENDLLNAQDREALRSWHEVEEQLLVQVDRLDDLVAVLRDFTGEDTSLMT